jgi:alanine racemase
MGTIASRAWAEIDLDAVANNLRYAQVRVGGSVGVMAVVKSNAYGHGAVDVAREVERCGAKALGVATLDEGIELRQAGSALPILVLGSSLECELEPAVRHGISVSLSPEELLQPIVETADTLGSAARVHLLVDTGMSRDGVPPEKAVRLAEQLADTPQVHLEGTYTHLATAVQPDRKFSHEQLSRFTQFIDELMSRDIHPGWVHCANSGALFTMPSSHFDMVRQGITLYGVAPSESVASQADLVPAMRVKTRILSVQELDTGDTAGYGRTFVARRPTRLATIAMGYADGLRVAMSDKGSVLLDGRRAPMVGRMMMDCALVDATHLPGVRAGGEVTVLGRSGRNEISAADLAAACGTIPYEALCSLGGRVKRTYTRGGKRVVPGRSPAERAAAPPLETRSRP